jgi:hypothetical protein
LLKKKERSKLHVNGITSFIQDLGAWQLNPCTLARQGGQKARKLKTWVTTQPVIASAPQRSNLPLNG